MPPFCVHHERPAAVEGARLGEGPEALPGNVVPALLDVLAGDELLLVPALNQARLLEPSHHLIEGRGAVLDAVGGEPIAELAAALFGVGHGFEHEHLEMGHGGQDGRHNEALGEHT
jgi:hypothetical protein